ncbi:MAG: ABC transporter ATP-binding protein [Lachnospiraceae bacterium]|nr:ABC transporter ATP-binding protein [Lachnospiraceae bacterium]
MIQVENLVKRYGGHVAVDDLTFTVEQGKIYGFLGPNGAGKTTTMNVMTGYIAADGGTVVIDGHDILKEPLAAKACIGYLPEIPPLYQDMTVREFLLFAAELKKVPKAERKERVAGLEERLSLSEMSRRLIKNLSKGYRQRVGLAQALVGDPKVLILDEPMVGLDPKQIIEMRDLIKGLAGEHTVILSSHILSEISAVCDHILIISSGKLAASGSPEELQKMMQGTAELVVTVIGEQEQAQAVLEQIGDIEQFTFEEGGEEGSILIRISTKNDVDIRKSLSVALAGAGIPILSMNRSEKSLEDIFLELTEAEEETETTEAAEEGPETETAEAATEPDDTEKEAGGTNVDETEGVTGEEKTDESDI